MADTIRSKAALQALLADNTIGDISAQDVRDFLVSVDSENANATGAIASLPAAQKGGFVYLPSDAPYVIRDTGAAYAYFGPVWPMTLPISTDFSWINQGAATVTAVNGFTYLEAPANAGDSHRCRVKTAPATPYTITALVAVNANLANTWGAGLLLRESGTGKLISFGVGCTGGPKVFLQKWTSPTVFSASYTSTDANVGFVQGPFQWLRMTDDGALLKFYLSADGYNFRQFESRSRTDFLAGGPNQVGYSTNSNSASVTVGLSVFSWKET